MWHKPEVYMNIRHPFSLAWREFCQSVGKEASCAEAVFHRYKTEIADEVARHAAMPSMSSQKAIRQMMVRPWQKPNLTKDDGVMEMSVAQIKRLCLEWLERNRQKVQ